MCRPAPGPRCSGGDQKTNERRRAQRAEAKAKKLAEQAAESSTEGTAGAPEVPAAPVELTKEELREQKRLAKEAREEEAERLNEIVENPDATAEELTAVFETAGHDWTHSGIAKHPNAPAPVLVAILNDPESYAQFTVLRHRNLPAAELQKALTQTEDRSLAEEAATSPYLTPAMIDDTIANGTDNQLFYLVENPTTTYAQLDAIVAKDSDYYGKVNKRKTTEANAIALAAELAKGYSPEIEKAKDNLIDAGGKEWRTPDGSKHRIYMKIEHLGAGARDYHGSRPEIYFDVKNESWYWSAKTSAGVRDRIKARAEELTGIRVS